jgi:uncharacterized protein (TIGR01440 family)
MDNIELIGEQAGKAFAELCQTSHFRPGSLIVVDGSTSVVRGGKIGKDSSYAIGTAIVTNIMRIAAIEQVNVCFSCCEHLNRAVVIERALAEKYNYQEVTAVPWLHGGGAVATNAFYRMDDPVLVEEVKADGGLDIGLTLIGMHLKRVAVPVHLKNNRVGEAVVVGARVRPPLIGGERAHYHRE